MGKHFKLRLAKPPFYFAGYTRIRPLRFLRSRNLYMFVPAVKDIAPVSIAMPPCSITSEVVLPLTFLLYGANSYDSMRFGVLAVSEMVFVAVLLYSLPKPTLRTGTGT